MKKVFTSALLILALLMAKSHVHAQYFYFPNVLSDAGCSNTFSLQSGVHITGVKIVQIYYDDGLAVNSTGSFSYEILFTYGNVFTGTPAPNSNFYTYTVSMYTDNPHTGSVITNNGSNIPMTTDTVGDMNLHNNPSYTGSASAMGLAVGIYTNPDTIAMFGFDSVSLVAAGPCLAQYTVGASENSSTPLAISLSGFGATMEGNSVLINWTTLSETDNAGFLVQRSSDSKTWSDIASVVSEAKSGNSITPLKYSVRDGNPANGINYYRLLQQNAYGSKTYSNVVTVLNNSQANEINIYPNPSTDVIHVSGKESFVNQPYKLMNVAGQTVFSGIVIGNGADIIISSIANGVYILQIGNEQRKVTILH